MKHFLFTSLLMASSLGYSATGWKVIAESKNCSESVRILAKEGEKYVLAVKGEEEKKLFSKDGSTFKENSPKLTEFKNETIAFNHPSVVDGNPPKITVARDGNVERCKMDLK